MEASAAALPDNDLATEAQQRNAEAERLINEGRERQGALARTQGLMLPENSVGPGLDPDAPQPLTLQPPVGLAEQLLLPCLLPDNGLLAVQPVAAVHGKRQDQGQHGAEPPTSRLP